ncbi:MAG: methionine synthase [Deltaproteobacteria bacterium]|nr:methionine synthase [Deltaproteobacteria bacterium]
MDFRDRLRQGVVVFDGAVGTQIQALALPPSSWRGREGCHEWLNLIAPEAIQRIHEAYLDAGADVVETNTFGANASALVEYGLADRIEEINRAAAAIARRAVASRGAGPPRFVAGSIGPGTKLASLGQVGFAALHASYLAQVTGLVAGGVDLLLIETVQDPLQLKAALLAARDALAAAGRDLPIAVSVTVEPNGALLVGTEIGAVLAIVEPFAVAALGINCSTGPEPMQPHLHQLCAQFGGPVLVQPNAGMPVHVDGAVSYPLAAEPFAAALARFVAEEGVSIVGGCCGTTPAHIAALAQAVRRVSRAPLSPSAEPALASLFRAQPLRQNPPPFLVGERANANGSREFKQRLLAEDWEGAVAVARGQEARAHAVDLCVAIAGRDEQRDMASAVERIARQVTLPLVIDSTDLGAIQIALERYGGRPLINSVNLEGGEERALAVCRLARRHGAALVALTIDEQGMALDVERKLAVAHRLLALAVERCGLRPQDLVLDALTLTLASGDPALRDAGRNTLQAVRRIKQELPGVMTLLGVSNISFGLDPAARDVLNSVFLARAVQVGLDLAIVNSERIVPLYQIAPADQELAQDLIDNRGDDPLRRYIDNFAARGRQPRPAAAVSATSLEERIQACVVDGSRAGLTELLDQQLARSAALEIIDRLLVPAMKRVGELFSTGQMQLPFVLQAAEVMKAAVDHLGPHLERGAREAPITLVLATVRGDVHDVGKNLVDIIVANNGYRVCNLGINCDIGSVLAKAQEVGADAIGLSGLLVKSTVVMREYLQEMERRGLRLPVLLGGAALTAGFVDEHCASVYGAPVVYCADAFAGLQALEQLAAGTLEDAVLAARVRRWSRPRIPVGPAAGDTLAPTLRPVAIPTPPFWGDRIVDDIALGDVFRLLDIEVIIRSRWGYRRGRLSEEAHQAQLRQQVVPQLEELWQRCAADHLIEPRVVYGYYPCRSQGDQLVIYRPGTSDEWSRLDFPRQRKPPHRCIADFFVSDLDTAPDVIALQVVTVGPRLGERERQLYLDHRYHDYLLLHGLGVEAAEALAEHWHQRVRVELGIAGDDGASAGDLAQQRYRGSRYSFGYPACPDLDENQKLFEILRPERIGVTLTESGQMVPEQTTSAFIAHHPQARYFTLGG